MAGFAIWSLRLQVAPACTPRIRENAPGVVCLGMQGNDDAPPLIVGWDEDPEGLNEGASATNGMAEILRHLHKCWSTRFDVERAVVVQRDSDGAFDFVLPEWPSIPTATGLVRVHWRPLRFPHRTSSERPRKCVAHRGAPRRRSRPSGLFRAGRARLPPLERVGSAANHQSRVDRSKQTIGSPPFFHGLDALGAAIVRLAYTPRGTILSSRTAF